MTHVQTRVEVLVRRTDVALYVSVALPDNRLWTVISPQVVVYNYGLDSQSFPVLLMIRRFGDIYSDTQQVTSLAPHESLVVTFKEDTLRDVGLFVAAAARGLPATWTRPMTACAIRSQSRQAGSAAAVRREFHETWY